MGIELLKSSKLAMGTAFDVVISWVGSGVSRGIIEGEMWTLRR